MAYNYYPNPYMNYGQNYSVPNYQQPYNSQMLQPTLPSIINQYPSINGKIVESVEVMNAQETPVGGYSVFPLVDFSKVFIKAYDKDGNIQTYKYDLVREEEILKEDIYADKLNDIYKYIEKLDKKIDDIKIPSPRKKKVVEEVDDDDE